MDEEYAGSVMYVPIVVSDCVLKRTVMYIAPNLFVFVTLNCDVSEWYDYDSYYPEMEMEFGDIEEFGFPFPEVDDCGPERIH